MYFLYFVLGASIILYFRFLILRTFLKKETLVNGFYAAMKAAYFSPLFFQALLLLWFALRNFRHICEGFVYCFRYWFLRKEDPPGYDFLYLVSYIGIGAMVIGIHAMLGKLSLNRRVDPLNILYKLIYSVTSYWLVKISIWNVGLFHPIEAQMDRLMLYNNAYVIVAGIMLYFTLLVQLYFKPATREIRYIQVGVLSSATYLLASMLLALLLVLVYVPVKLLS